MSILPAINQLVSMLIVIILGYFLAKKKILDDKTTRGLSILLTAVASPPVIINSMQIPFTTSALGDVGLACIGMTITVLIGVMITFLYCRFRKIPARETGVWLLSVGFPNTLFIGKPIVTALFGDSASFYVVSVILPYNLLVFSLGIILIQMGTPRTKRRGLKSFLSSLCNPSFLSCIIAFLLFAFSITLPAFLTEAMEMIGPIGTPLSLLVVGYSLAHTDLKALWKNGKVYTISVIRLIITPLICLLILRLFISDPIMLGAFVMLAAMPVGAIPSALSEQYDNSPEFVSSNILVSTLLCVVTIPLISLLFP